MEGLEWVKEEWLIKGGMVVDVGRIYWGNNYCVESRQVFAIVFFFFLFVGSGNNFAYLVIFGEKSSSVSFHEITFDATLIICDIFYFLFKTGHLRGIFGAFGNNRTFSV